MPEEEIAELINSVLPKGDTWSEICKVCPHTPNCYGIYYRRDKRLDKLDWFLNHGALSDVRNLNAFIDFLRYKSALFFPPNATAAMKIAYKSLYNQFCGAESWEEVKMLITLNQK